MTVPANLTYITNNESNLMGAFESPFFSIVVFFTVMLFFLYVYNKREKWNKPSANRLSITVLVAVIMIVPFLFSSWAMENLYPYLTTPFVLSAFLVLPLVITGLSNAVAGGIAGIVFTFTHLTILYNLQSNPEWFYLYFLINPALTAMVARKLSDKSSFFFWFGLAVGIQILVGFII